MNAYLIAIGDELLSGRTLDTNSNFIAKQLDRIGISTIKISTIFDDPETIKNELLQATLSKADFIFTTGGLGPTKDDKTKQTIADFLSDVLIFNQDCLDHVSKLYTERGRILNELTRNQALVPSRSLAIVNRYGTAPILWSKAKNNKILINLPGVPYETRAMMEETIIPKIKSEFKLPFILRKSLTVINYPESELAIALTDWENELPKNISLSYLPAGSRIELRLTIKGEDKDLMEKLVSKEIEKLPEILGDRLISKEDINIIDLISDFLKKEQLSIALAESITGGSLSQCFTSVPGCSSYYKGGIIAYNTKIKENILNVPRALIDEHTVVSKEVAEAMAINTAKIFQTDIAISTTGVAGPNTDEYNNPVGLAYVGLFYKGEVFSEKFVYSNLTREEMILRISNKAIEFLYNIIIMNK
ncbi:CinA family nicotinamide mononucleotide deamidase-related protein [Apibacter muscae]|uniref:CinA family nicotinamide mononucleotide deamidase-related protein n=1 Tax=Apibacter muscae TaxID=2509004 RepID=UPI0011ACF46B|nr:CinA family nicotinamide mononucleotide deamidase-related protein [Apibacter muscae]TWP29558.1 CinA family nicotinamide mononucleotide deamidase-related protein [Apibacter muscae]